MHVLQHQTYVGMIENAVGTRIFNSLFIRDIEGKVTHDLLNDGEFSCARFVSGLLYLIGFVPLMRSTVDSLERDLLHNPLVSQIPHNERLPGDILIWEAVTYADNSSNRHVGFALSEDEAVSTSYVEKCVIRHPIDRSIENGAAPRRIERVLRVSHV